MLRVELAYSNDESGWPDEELLLNLWMQLLRVVEYFWTI
jgi:hypothetical protein